MVLLVSLFTFQEEIELLLRPPLSMEGVITVPQRAAKMKKVKQVKAKKVRAKEAKEKVVKEKVVKEKEVREREAKEREAKEREVKEKVAMTIVNAWPSLVSALPLAIPG